MIIDRVTNKSRGFGFVNFEDQASMQAAIEQMHLTELEGRPITVRRAQPKDKSAAPEAPQIVRPRAYGVDRRSAGVKKPSKKFRVNIRNLPTGCTWTTLKDFIRDRISDDVEYTATNGDSTGYVTFAALIRDCHMNGQRGSPPSLYTCDTGILAAVS